MTERLYYEDAYRFEFDATVLGSTTLEDGRLAVRLDRTAFYPTSGGQPFDVGTLGGTPVVDVMDSDDGEVLHVIAGPLEEGSRVSGRVDSVRRFDHMQQHTGQHILSAAFERICGARTESFHLGADYATIDLSRDLAPAEIAGAEADANRIVWEDRPVGIRFVDAAEAASLPLRKEPARRGVLRLVEVDGYDLSACGGTHVARTGSIGIIAIAGWERFRSGVRVEFVCGGRALRAFGRLRDVTAASARLLSVQATELPASIERLHSEAKDARRRVKEAHARLAGAEAEALAGAAPDGIVVAALDGWDQQALKSIASAIVSRPGYVAGLFAVPGPSPVVIARSVGVKVDCGAVLKDLVARFGGKGGGRPELAQGGGLQGDPTEISARLLELLRAGPL